MDNSAPPPSNGPGQLREESTQQAMCNVLGDSTSAPWADNSSGGQPRGEAAAQSGGKASEHRPPLDRTPLEWEVLVEEDEDEEEREEEEEEEAGAGRDGNRAARAVPPPAPPAPRRHSEDVALAESAWRTTTCLAAEAMAESGHVGPVKPVPEDPASLARSLQMLVAALKRDAASLRAALAGEDAPASPACPGGKLPEQALSGRPELGRLSVMEARQEGERAVEALRLVLNAARRRDLDAATAVKESTAALPWGPDPLSSRLPLGRLSMTVTLLSRARPSMFPLK